MTETSGEFRKVRPYGKVVLKISGESLGATNSVDAARFGDVADQIATLRAEGIQCAVVVGGGNIFRGRDASMFGLSDEDGDLIGMLATGINAKALAGACVKRGVDAIVVTRGPCRGFGLDWSGEHLRHASDSGRVVIIAGGSGVPGVSTDVPAMQLAIDIRAEAVIMAKSGVSGVYTADPKYDSHARLLPEITASDALALNLNVMDRSALELSRAHACPVHIVDADHPGGLALAATGSTIGSKIYPR